MTMAPTNASSDNSNQMKSVGIRLPLIPLSPLTQTSIEYAKALAQTTKSLSETTAACASSSTSNNIISSLNKDLCKERENLDRLTKEIQNIQSKSLTDLDNYEIAKEIAYINCSLFRLVVLNKSWMSNFDKQSNIVPLLDFHRYLSHSFAHQVIYSASEEEFKLSAKNKRKSLSRSNTNNANTIAQLIQIAYILLHIYRDFSGCTAVLTSLQMPEVQRLEKLWSQCSVKTIATYKELVKMLSPDNNYEAYHHQLWLHTARFLNGSPLKSQTVAVPFMHAHLTVIRNLIHTHSAVMNSNKQSIVLSESGKKSFISAIHVLEFCQQHTRIEPTELDRPITLASASRRISSSSSKRNSVNATGFKLAISSCLDLDKLHTSPNTYHWIVSRAYLTRAQLHQESLQVEPLAIGEIELETEEEYDLYWDFFSQPPIPETQRKRTSNPTSILKEIAKIDTLLSEPEERELTQLQQQIENQSIANDSTLVSNQPNQGEENANDVAQVADVLPSQLDQSQTSDTQKLNEEDEAVMILEETHQTAVGEQKQKDSEESTASENVENINDTDATGDENGLIDNADDHPVTTPKPILSPAAPEFVPQKQNHCESLSEEDDEDDIIIITEEMSYTKEANKPNEEDDGEEEEEWTGYPLDNTSSSVIEEMASQDEDEEEEEWTGYPVTSQDEDEDDDEVWKGYPAPQQDQQTNHSPKSIELSSPSTPHEEPSQSSSNANNQFNTEEWKGYGRSSNEQHALDKNKVPQTTLVVNRDYPSSWDSNKNQLHAIGKAAARKLQYSVSTTDNRKPLPTMFTPSAST